MNNTRKFSAAQKARADKRWGGDRPGNAETVPDGYRGDAETIPDHMPGEYPNDASHSHSQTPQPKPQPQPERTDTAARLSARPDEKIDFESFKAAYPKRPGGQRWSLAIKRANARIEEGATFQDMINGACGYAAYCDATEKTGTEYVMQDSDAANGLVARAANRFLGKADREAASVLSNAQRHTHFLDSRRIAKVLSRSDFHFSELRHRITSVFLVLPPYSRWLRLLVFSGPQ